MDSKLIVIRRFPTIIEAEVARSALEASNLAAAIQRGPHHQLVASFDLIVREDDVRAADEILRPDDAFSN